MNIVIVGASGGIGLAIVKSCLKRYPQVAIFATYNSHKISFEHSKVQWFKVDVGQEQQIENFAKHIGKVDIVINAIGILHADKQKPETALKNVSAQFFNKNISLNTLPSILLAKHFERGLKADTPTFFIAVSAKIGSIADNQVGGWLSYRSSKAALNMALKTISIEWQRKLPNSCVFLFHPGTTDTELSKPFQRNLPEGQLHSAEFTAEALLALLAKFGPQDTGTFISYDGTKIQW